MSALAQPDKDREAERRPHQGRELVLCAAQAFMRSPSNTVRSCAAREAFSTSASGETRIFAFLAPPNEPPGRSGPLPALGRP